MDSHINLQHKPSNTVKLLRASHNKEKENFSECISEQYRIFIPT
jgi:hypothetical protein